MPWGSGLDTGTKSPLPRTTHLPGSCKPPSIHRHFSPSIYIKLVQHIADAPGEVKTVQDRAGYTLTKASSSPGSALTHSCHSHIPTLLGLWGKGRAVWGHLCMLRHTAGMWLPSVVGGWIPCSGEGCASPSAKSQCDWDVSCLGMAQQNVQPPSSIKAALSSLSTPSVPPYCLHVQEYVGPYPAWLGHKTSLKLNGAAFPFWFNIISNFSSDLKMPVLNTWDDCSCLPAAGCSLLP